MILPLYLRARFLLWLGDRALTRSRRLDRRSAAAVARADIWLAASRRMADRVDQARRDSATAPAGDLLYGSKAIAAHLGVAKGVAVHLIRSRAVPWFALAGVACARRSTLATYLDEMEERQAATVEPAAERSPLGIEGMPIADLAVLYATFEGVRDTLRSSASGARQRPRIEAFVRQELELVQTRMDACLRRLAELQPATSDERHARFAPRLRAALELEDWTKMTELHQEDEALREAGLIPDPLPAISEP